MHSSNKAALDDSLTFLSELHISYAEHSWTALRAADVASVPFILSQVHVFRVDVTLQLYWFLTLGSVVTCLDSETLYISYLEYEQSQLMLFEECPVDVENIHDRYCCQVMIPSNEYS